MSNIDNERQLSDLEVAQVLESLITGGRGFNDGDGLPGLGWTGLQGGPFGNDQRERDKRTVVRMMAELIPPEMRYRSVLERMDRTVLFDEVANTTTDDDVAKIAREWSESLAPEVDAALEAEAALVEAGQIDASSTTITGDSPDQFLQVFQQMAGGNSAQSQTVPFLTDDDVTAIFRRSSSDAAAIQAYENQLAQYRAGVDPNFSDPYSISPTDADAYREQVRSESPEARRYVKAGESYTLSEARDLLYGMTAGEIRTLQTKLMDAGYFLTDDAAGNEPLLWGDPTDARTQSAWRALIGDSVRTGQPLYTTLEARILSAEENELMTDEEAAAEEEQQPRPDVVLTDPARIRTNADDMARGMIGRKLSDDENAALVDFIQGLERDSQNARFDQPGFDSDGNPVPTHGDLIPNPDHDIDYGKNPELGPGGNSMAQPGPREWEEGEPAPGTPGGASREFTSVDVNARIEEYIRNQNPTEAEGRDVALSYNDFAALLGGPGRGGSF